MLDRTTILLGCLFAGAGLAPLAAQANPIVSMELTGTKGPSMSGVYTDPYYAKIGPKGLTTASQFTTQNSYTAAIYCDDYFDDVSVGHIWQATVTNLGALSSTSPVTTLMFETTNAATQEKDYMAAAWLAEQIAGFNQKLPSGALKAEQYSYAIWYIFDPSALSALASTNYTAAVDDEGLAFDKVAGDTPGDFSNVNVYTPIPSTPGHAGSQEYLTVSTPEPSTFSLAALGLAAVVLAARRRRAA